MSSTQLDSSLTRVPNSCQEDMSPIPGMARTWTAN